MFCKVVLLVACLVAAGTAEELPCMKLGDDHRSVLRCCKKLLPGTPNKHSEELKKTIKQIQDECIPKLTSGLPPPKGSCELEICSAKIIGYGMDDGTFDKTILADEFKKHFQEESEYEKFKKNCIEGDLSKYGPPEYCDLKKFKYCADAHFLLHCQEWNNEEDECSEVQALVEQCT